MKKTKRITIKELAQYYGVHRNTMAARMNTGEGKRVDLTDPQEIIRFIRYLFKYE